MSFETPMEEGKTVKKFLEDFVREEVALELRSAVYAAVRDRMRKVNLCLWILCPVVVLSFGFSLITLLWG